jgi:hypothetical protein
MYSLLKKWLVLTACLILPGSVWLYAQGSDISGSSTDKKWSFREAKTPAVDSVTINDSISDPFWGHWYITTGPSGLGLLDKDRKNVLNPCFKSLTYRAADGELELLLPESRYTLFLLEVPPAGRRDSIRVSTKTEKCPACNGHKYRMEEVLVQGTELRSTEYRKEVTAINDRYKTIQVSRTEKRRPARDGYQWQERKCNTCQGSGLRIKKIILVRDLHNDCYQEI